jgi:hypothetical protein
MSVVAHGIGLGKDGNMSKKGDRPITTATAQPRVDTGLVEASAESPGKRDLAPPSAGHTEDLIEIESQGSFPASDAPSWTIVRVGTPRKS